VLVSFIGVVEIFRQSQIRQAATFNYTPYLVTALVFLAVTIPLARFTDWLISRERDRRYAASVRAGSSSARRGRLFGWPR
jgi:polar amino acid transport system permease protein